MKNKNDGTLPRVGKTEIIKIQKAQREQSLLAYKMDAKKVAVQYASYSRPSNVNTHFNIVAVAEKIYQWMLKGI